MSTTRPIYAKSAVLACLLVLALLQKPLEVDGHELHTMTRTPIDFSNVDEIEPCGFEEPDKETLLIMQEEAIQSSMENARRPFLELLVQIFCAFFPRNSVCNIVIPVYVHNIESNSGEGHLSDDQIREMIQIGNDHLASTGFVLRLMRIKRRVSTDLYASFVRSPEETEMMTQMREGGPETMNVFIKRVHTPTGAFCGVASLARSARSSGARDGILLMPGCALHDKTFAHEIGHWLNLLHTFSGGCHPGDLVDDTPAQSQYLGRIHGPCPASFPDSCPDHPGQATLDNMMDYNPIQCDDLFTSGQIERMKAAWREFRQR